MKKFMFVVSLIACFGMLLVGCSSNNSNASTANGGKEEQGNAEAQNTNQEKVEFSFGHVMPIDHPEHIAATKFSEILAEKSNGRIKANIFPSSQLGGSRELMTSVMNGTIQMAATSTFGTIDKKLLAVEMPYIFRDFDHISEFTKSDVSTNLLSRLEDQKVHGMGFWTVGYRNVGNSKKPVHTPEDLKGLMIRAFENELLTDTLKALGANVTVLPYPEVYMALQTGTIDGEENPYVNTHAMKFFEGEKYKTETRHLNNFEIVGANLDWWNSLSSEDQEIISSSFAEATEYYMELEKEADEKYKQELKNEGMEIIEIDDYQPWIDAVQPVYEKWEAELGKDLIDSIKNIGK